MYIEVTRLWLRDNKGWVSVLYVLYLFWELTVFLKVLVVLVSVLSVPLYQPVFGFVLRLLRDLGGRRLRAGGEEVFHCELAWVSTGVSVRIWHCWSLQIQLLLVAQSSSSSFLLEIFHLAGLVRKFPFILKLLLGRDLGIY